jgi:hypothetical protein
MLLLPAESTLHDSRRRIHLLDNALLLADTGDDDARFGLSEEDLQNMQLPPDLLQNMQLPSELQKECTIM